MQKGVARVNYSEKNYFLNYFPHILSILFVDSGTGLQIREFAGVAVVLLHFFRISENARKMQYDATRFRRL